MARRPLQALSTLEEPRDTTNGTMLLSRWPDRVASPETLVDRIHAAVGMLRDLSDHPRSEFRSDHPFAGIEERLGHLQASIADLQRDVAQMKMDLRDTRERACHLQARMMRLPSKAALRGAVLLMVVTVIGTVSFQREIYAFASAVLGRWLFP